MMRKGLVVLAAVIVIAGISTYIAISGGEARLQEGVTVGPTPTIPDPDRRLIPTINIAPATGWPSGEKPNAAPGLTVAAWATGLDHPANGDAGGGPVSSRKMGHCSPQTAWETVWRVTPSGQTICQSGRN